MSNDFSDFKRLHSDFAHAYILFRKYERDPDFEGPLSEEDLEVTFKNFVAEINRLRSIAVTSASLTSLDLYIMKWPMAPFVFWKEVPEEYLDAIDNLFYLFGHDYDFGDWHDI